MNEKYEIDLIVDPRPRTEEDFRIISEAIAKRKKELAEEKKNKLKSIVIKKNPNKEVLQKI